MQFTFCGLANMLTDTSGKLHTRIHDRYAVNVLEAHLGVHREVDKIVLSDLLDRLDGHP